MVGSGRGAIHDDDDNFDDDDDDDHDRDKRIAFYCLPCVSFGVGVRGKCRVRALTLVFFPLFLLGTVLLNDLGRAVEGGMGAHSSSRMRRGIGSTPPPGSAPRKFTSEAHPVPRCKWISKFPGLRTIVTVHFLTSFVVLWFLAKFLSVHRV
jgi:hypothetical protein